MQKSLCLSVRLSDVTTGSLTSFFGCIFLVGVASFLPVASLDHFSRLLLLFSVPSFTLCFSANALNVIFVVSHSFCIFSQFGIYMSPTPIELKLGTKKALIDLSAF